MTASAPQLPFLLVAPDDDDEAFVDHQLLPALGLDDSAVRQSSRLEPGRLTVDSLAHYVANSSVALAIVSPALLRSGMSALAIGLVELQRQRGGRVFPLLRDGECPDYFQTLRLFDCTSGKGREHAFAELRAILQLPSPHLQDLPCPYPGLRPYDEAATSSFAGREADVRRLATKLAPPGGVRELFLLGPSGVGKTSFLHAGLFPELRRRAGAALELRAVRPAELLAAAQADRESDPPPEHVAHPTLIAIDPLEEIFALAPEQRAVLLAHLERLRADPQLQILYCLRSDFRAALRASPFAPAFESAERENLEPLQGTALVEALCAPARALKVELAPALLRRLQHEAPTEERGSLPLLQLALAALWPHREYNLLTEDSYQQLAGPHASGLSAILEAQASRAIHSLPHSEDRRVALRVLLRLVQFGEGRADTRRRQSREALSSGEPPAQLQRVLDHLTEHRILLQDSSGDEPSVDLAHETLIEAWPSLQRFLHQYRAAEHHRRALEQRARQWSARAPSAPHDGLLDEIEVQEAHQVLGPEAREELGLSPVLAEFLRASQEHLAAERATHERRLQQQRAQLARYLVDKAHSFLRGGRPVRAFPLLLEARGHGATGTAFSSLFHWARRGLPISAHPAEAARLPPPAALASALLERSPLGSHVAIARGRVLRLLDLASDTEPKRIEVSANITGIFWAPDCLHLAVASDDHTVRLWDAATGNVDSPLLEQPSAIQRLEWRSPSTLLVATATAELYWRPRYPPAPSPDALAAAPPAPPAMLDGDSRSKELRAIAADRNVHITSASRRIRLDHRHPVVALAWSPEGDRLAVACRDGAVRVWSPLDELVLVPDLSCKGITSIDWSADGEHLFAYAREAVVRCWPTPRSAPTSEEWDEASRAHGALTAAPEL